MAMESERNKVMAALSYISILFLVPMLAAKGSDLAQFHVRQGIALFVVSVVLGLVPVIGWAGEVGVVIVAVYGAVQALQGKYWEMPILGKYAKKIKL